MRKRSVHIVFLTCILLILSCRSLHLTTIDSHDAIQPLLPPLEIEFDYYSFENALDNPDEYYTEFEALVSNYEYLGPVPPYFGSTIQNLSSMFEQVVTKNLSELKGEKRGYITCRVSQSLRDSKLRVFSVISSITLGILNLVGLPVSQKSMEMVLQVDIYDLDNKLVARYFGKGASKVTIAMYYGYDFEDAKEKSVTDATYKALQDIISQIEKDASDLRIKLD